MKKILLDTNMFIYILDHHVLDPKVEKLTRMLLDSEEYKIVIHPKTILEAQKIKDSELKDIFTSKLRIYKQIDDPPIPTDEFIQLVKATSENDRIDCELLYSVKQNCVSYFITNDIQLKKKSVRIGLNNKVLNIDEALEKFKPKKEEYIEIPVFIKEDYLRNMDLADPFFDSLREDYEDFDGWFQRKQGEGKKAFIIRNRERQVTSFLMLKEEEIDDDDETFFKKLPKVKRLKVSTLKVTNKGKRIGETFIKIMMRVAMQKRVGLIYVTIFPKQEKLISVLSEYGFKLYTTKITKNAKGEVLKENVYVKEMGDYNYYPNIDYTDQRIFLVPIRPIFNKLLFPESEINPQLTFDDLEGDITSANAIKKAYICNSNTKQIRAGDLLFFYSTRENMRLTAIGIVDIVCNSFENFDEIKKLVNKRTAYTDEQLREATKQDSLVILFKHYLTFEKEITYKDLLNMGVISSGIQQIQKIDLKKMKKIIEKDESIKKMIKIN
ncbi:MAG: hypothetical protein U0L98_07550 [Clostridia bacterium]|nr:hypothetical protein [Clostridia bacterium]